MTSNLDPSPLSAKPYPAPPPICGRPLWTAPINLIRIITVQFSRHIRGIVVLLFSLTPVYKHHNNTIRLTKQYKAALTTCKQHFETPSPADVLCERSPRCYKCLSLNSVVIK